MRGAGCVPLKVYMTRDDYFLFVFFALFFLEKSVTKISRSSRIVTRFLAGFSTALAREKNTHQRLPRTPPRLHSLSLTAIRQKGLTTHSVYYREEKMRMIMSAFRMYTAALYRIQCYGPATAQEALSQFQSSAIENNYRCDRSKLSWNGRAKVSGRIHSRNGDACKRIKINNNLTIGRYDSAVSYTTNLRQDVGFSLKG